MPYVRSKKTDGKATDREVLDEAVEYLADYAAQEITTNRSLIKVYRSIFVRVARLLNSALVGRPVGEDSEANLAKAITRVSATYNYKEAYLGEFNYAITRFIQRVPAIKVQRGEWRDEFWYWVYAATAAALGQASRQVEDLRLGLDGVLEDVKDEYKRRVNTAYEAAQILKNGDCYDTPYYTKLIEVVDEDGQHVGHMEVMLERSASTVSLDVLGCKIVVTRNKKQVIVGSAS